MVVLGHKVRGRRIRSPPLRDGPDEVNEEFIARGERSLIRVRFGGSAVKEERSLAKVRYA
jgi:hypothetical protein